jgi:hypothetical protein
MSSYSGSHLAPIQRVPGALSQGQSGWDVKLTADFNLVPRLRMRGAVPPLSHVSSSWRAEGQLNIFTFYTTLPVALFLHFYRDSVPHCYVGNGHGYSDFTDF